MLEIDENSRKKTAKYPGTRSTTRVPGYPGNEGTVTRVTERVPGKITSVKYLEGQSCQLKFNAIGDWKPMQ